jgi:hypothetical protein
MAPAAPCHHDIRDAWRIGISYQAFMDDWWSLRGVRVVVVAVMVDGADGVVINMMLHVTAAAHVGGGAVSNGETPS